MPVKAAFSSFASRARMHKPFENALPSVSRGWFVPGKWQILLARRNTILFFIPSHSAALFTFHFDSSAPKSKTRDTLSLLSSALCTLAKHLENAMVD